MSNEKVIGIQPLGLLQDVRSDRSKPMRSLPIQKNVQRSSNKSRHFNVNSSGSKHVSHAKGVFTVPSDVPSGSYASLNSMAGFCAPSGQNITQWLCKHAVKVKKMCRKASVSSNEKKKLVQQKLACEPEKNVSVTETCVASNEMKNKAYKICREFLSGSWKSISSNDMIFKTVGGGLSNLLYYCSLPETHTPLCGEPSQVLMRMYGQIHGDQDTSTITESIICTLLSERALGPKLFGVFPGGRLEEYIPARALITEQIRQPEISLSISRKLARLHALQAPLTKEPTWLFDNMEKWLAVRSEINMNSISKAVKPHARKLLEFDYKREMAWLRDIFKKAQSPVMFCHNDLQEGNILHMEGKESKGSTADENLVFIDFEYCAYNYRGFDLANHFCEWAYDYSHPEYPLFKESIDQYPSEAQRRVFLEEYLETLRTTSIHGDIDPKVNTIEHLLEEAETFTLASHIFWSLWALNSAYTSKISFGYWEYGAARLQRYLELKERLVERLELSSN